MKCLCYLGIMKEGFLAYSSPAMLICGADVLPESTMFPVMTISPLTLPLHAAQVPASHMASLFDAGNCSVHLKTKKVLQLTLYPPTAPYHHRTPWVLYSRHAKSPSIPCVMTYV